MCTHLQLFMKTIARETFYRLQRSWGKVMFLQVSVILLTGGVRSVHAGIHPSGADTPRSRQPPQGPDTPLKQTPPEQTPREQTPPQEQTPPRANTSPWSRHPKSRHLQNRHPHNRHPLGADIPPPRSRHHTYPLPSPQSMLGDTVNAQAVRILLECNLVCIYMSHFAYACKMRYLLNLVLESWEYLWFY